jgi:hypothetical protein
VTLPQLQLDEYLRILRDPAIDPFPDADTTGAVGSTFRTLTAAMADFVDACRASDELTYPDARRALEDLVHALPMPTLPPEFVQLLAFLRPVAEATDPDAVQ